MNVAIPTAAEWPCPDGRPWCTGAKADHADPREHIHKGPEQSINGACGVEVLAAYLVQFDDDEPEIAFAGSGDWPALNVEQANELVEKLRALRDQLAGLREGNHRQTPQKAREGACGGRTMTA